MVRIDVAEFDTIAGDGGFSGYKILSEASGLIALTLLVSLCVESDFFNANHDPLSDAQIDNLKSMQAQAISEIINEATMSPVAVPVGFIMAYAGNTPTLTDDYLLCDGAMYTEVDYPGLYSVLDPSFVIDTNYFVVPDLNGRMVQGAETFIGAVGGETTITLSTSQIPSHAHNRNTSGVAEYVVAQSSLGSGSVGNKAFVAGIAPTYLRSTGANEGGGGSHSNMPPYLNLRYYIKAR